MSLSLDRSPPLTNLPNPRRKKKNGGGQLREHVTGCARSEGYYAISRKEKDVYLDLDLPEQVIREVENVDTSVRAPSFTFSGSFRINGSGRVAKNKLKGKSESTAPPEGRWQPPPMGSSAVVRHLRGIELAGINPRSDSILGRFVCFHTSVEVWSSDTVFPNNNNICLLVCSWSAPGGILSLIQLIRLQ